MIEKNEDYFVAHESYGKFDHKHGGIGTPPPICLRMACACSPTPRPELRSHPRDRVALKAGSIYSLALSR
jgi:hypothetical protein